MGYIIYPSNMYAVCRCIFIKSPSNQLVAQNELEPRFIAGVGIGEPAAIRPNAAHMDI